MPTTADIVRALLNRSEAKSIGRDAALLVVFLSGGPRKYWDFELMRALGLPTADLLQKIRDRAVAAGWLSVKPLGRGAYQYAVNIPAETERGGQS
jgi:hypothetical protein